MRGSITMLSSAQDLYGGASPIFLWVRGALRPQIYPVDEETILKVDMGHGEARVSFGNGERPKYRALSQAINDFFADLQRPLLAFRSQLFMALSLEDATKAFARGQKQDDTFRFTTKMARQVDGAAEEFLVELFGPERDREAFSHRVPTDDQPDGIVQQYDQLGHAIGVVRGSRLAGESVSLDTSRTSADVVAMLENSFDRLSVSGQLRLESVSDDIKALLVSYQDAGLSPLEAGRELSARFDQYEGWQFERLARTEMAYASEAGMQNQLKDYGVENVEILISAGACPICEAFADQLIPLDDTDRLPPYHPNCLCSISPVVGFPGF